MKWNLLNVWKELEAAQAQAELERRAAEAVVKEEEAKRLEEELRRTQLEMEEKQRALHEALTTPQQLHVHEHDEDDEESDLKGTCDIPIIVLDLSGTWFVQYWVLFCFVLYLFWWTNTRLEVR